VIFDIVEYSMMEWTMPNESRLMICRMCRRLAKSVAGQFAAVSTGQKRIDELNREDYEEDKYLFEKQNAFFLAG
jgi:hypothetical protein